MSRRWWSTHPKVLLALAMAGALVAVSITLGSANWRSAGEVAGETPPTNTPSAKACSGDSRACMVLQVADPPGVCAGAVCQLDFNEKFTLAGVLEKVPEEGYILAQSAIQLGAGLDYKPKEDGAYEIVLAGCALALRIPLEPLDIDDFAAHQCLTGIMPPLPVLFTTGSFAELSVTCSSEFSSNLIELLPAQNSGDAFPGTNGSLFRTDGNDALVPDMEHVRIDCGMPPETPETQTPTMTHTPGGTITPAIATQTNTPAPGLPSTATSTLTPTPDLEPPTTTLTPATPANTSTPEPPTNTLTKQPTDTPGPGVLGDVSCDGRTDPTDSLFILQKEAALLNPYPCPDGGDVNMDGVTTLVDAALILQYAAGLLATLPP